MLVSSVLTEHAVLDRCHVLTRSLQAIATSSSTSCTGFKMVLRLKPTVLQRYQTACQQLTTVSDFLGQRNSRATYCNSRGGVSKQIKQACTTLRRFHSGIIHIVAQSKYDCIACLV